MRFILQQIFRMDLAGILYLFGRSLLRNSDHCTSNKWFHKISRGQLFIFAESVVAARHTMHGSEITILFTSDSLYLAGEHERFHQPPPEKLLFPLSTKHVFQATALGKCPQCVSISHIAAKSQNHILESGLQKTFRCKTHQPRTPNNQEFKWMELVVISNHFPSKGLVHHPVETTVKNGLF